MQPAAVYMERAQARVQACDFGEDSFQEGLERLIRALETEARLNAAGHAAMEAQIVAFLCGRLQLQAWLAEHPHALEHPVAAPLIGLGLPRTGSSALACLLAEDGATRSLRTWESLSPFPPPDTRSVTPDPRIAQAEAAMARRAEAHPRLVAMLPSSARSPVECQQFMAYDFKSQLFQCLAHVPSYVRWLTDEADLRPTYRLVKAMLQMLQAHAPGARWRLKNPSHCLFIEALDAVFPDARYVMTHRSPAAVVASVADLYSEYRGDFTDSVDLLAIGRETGDFCETAMRRMIAFRDAGREDRVFDIGFDDFQADPLREVAALYDFLGEPLSPQARSAMQAWWRGNAGPGRDYARTPARAFGLDPAALEARFGFYTDRFGPSALADRKGRLQ